jgi:hypothetical protein
MIQEVDLTEIVDKQNTDCCNCAAGHGMDEFLDGRASLESDVGGELLLRITFSQHVKLNSLVLRVAMARPPEEIPVAARLFVDKPDLTLRDAPRVRPTQELTLDRAAITAAAHIPLKYVLFQNVASVAVHLRSANPASGRVSLGGCRFFGTTRQATNLKDWSKVVAEQKGDH